MILKLLNFVNEVLILHKLDQNMLVSQAFDENLYYKKKKKLIMSNLKKKNKKITLESIIFHAQ